MKKKKKKKEVTFTSPVKRANADTSTSFRHTKLYAMLMPPKLSK